MNHPKKRERTENEKVGAHGADAGEMRVQVAQWGKAEDEVRHWCWRWLQI